jgi:hypothetical protein
MRESNKKQLNVLLCVLICVFGAVGVFAVSVSNKQIGEPSAAIAVQDDSEGGSVTGASAALVPLESKITLYYGQKLPDKIACVGGGTADVTWPYTLNRRPTTGEFGAKNVTLTRGADSNQASIYLEVLPGPFTLGQLNFTTEFGTALPSSVANCKNYYAYQDEGNLSDEEKSRFQFTASIKWKNATPSVEDMGGAASMKMEYSASAAGGKAYSENHITMTGEADVTVTPLIIDVRTQIVSTHPYMTPYAEIFSNFANKIKSDLFSLDTVIKNKVASGLTFVHKNGDTIDTDRYFDVSGDPYELAAKLTTPSVLFSNGSGGGSQVSSLCTISLTITKRTIGSGNVKTVHHQTYTGKPREATFTFAFDKNTKNERTFDPYYTVTYYANASDGSLMSAAPVTVGVYRAKIEINDPNYIVPGGAINVDYRIEKAKNMLDFIEDVTYEGSTNIDINVNGTGSVRLPFEMNGITPKVGLDGVTFNGKSLAEHGITYTVSYKMSNETGTEFTAVNSLLVAGTYTVTFTFSSPNIESAGVDIDYEISFVDALDPNNGLDKILDSIEELQEIIAAKTLTLEYSGKALTGFDFLTNNAELKKYKIVCNVVNAYDDRPILDIGAYAVTFEPQSPSHTPYEPITLSLNIVKKTIQIPTAAVKFKFDASEKKHIPAVSTGIAGVSAAAKIVSITDDKGGSYDIEKGVKSAGNYKFEYALVDNALVKAENVTVDVIIEKASKAELETLIRRTVVFNNKAIIDPKKTETFTPAAAGTEALIAYGVEYRGIPAPFSTNEDFKTVQFGFFTENYDMQGDVFNYSVRYDMLQESNAWVIFVVVGVLAALVAASYLASFIGKRKPVAAGVRPYDRTPTIYQTPKYKPDSPGPKPPKEKKEKLSKEEKEKLKAAAAAPKPEPKPVKKEVRTKNPLDLMSNMKMGTSKEIGKFSNTDIYQDSKK